MGAQSAHQLLEGEAIEEGHQPTIRSSLESPHKVILQFIPILGLQFQYDGTYPHRLTLDHDLILDLETSPLLVRPRLYLAGSLSPA